MTPETDTVILYSVFFVKQWHIPVANKRQITLKLYFVVVFNFCVKLYGDYFTSFYFPFKSLLLMADWLEILFSR